MFFPLEISAPARSNRCNFPHLGAFDNLALGKKLGSLPSLGSPPPTTEFEYAPVVTSCIPTCPRRVVERIQGCIFTGTCHSIRFREAAKKEFLHLWPGNSGLTSLPAPSWPSDLFTFFGLKISENGF